jgi:pheromone shutdown-related protein TraB
MGRIKVIGTSHIAHQSTIEIQEAIEEERPEFIAIELDIQRLQALVRKQKSRIGLLDIKQIGFKGFLFAMVGSYVQKKLGRMVGTTPGADMLQAVKLAKVKKISLVLIDRPIALTLRRFSQMLSWKERFRFLWDILKGVFFPRRELKRYGLDKLDLGSVPEERIVNRMLSELKNRYPNVHQVLIEERNDYMIHQLKELTGRHPDSKVLAVVGAGHKRAIISAVSSW